jgi:hypothetical protein
MIEEDTITSAVADSFASMIDDILVAYGASQIVISEDMTSTPVVGYADAVRLGESAYIYATVAFNAIAIVLMIFEAHPDRKLEWPVEARLHEHQKHHCEFLC